MTLSGEVWRRLANLRCNNASCTGKYATCTGSSLTFIRVPPKLPPAFTRVPVKVPTLCGCCTSPFSKGAVRGQFFHKLGCYKSDFGSAAQKNPEHLSSVSCLHRKQVSAHPFSFFCPCPPHPSPGNFLPRNPLFLGPQIYSF